MLCGIDYLTMKHLLVFLLNKYYPINKQDIAVSIVSFVKHWFTSMTKGSSNFQWRLNNTFWAWKSSGYRFTDRFKAFEVTMDSNETRQTFVIAQLAIGILNIAINSFFIHAARKLGKFRRMSYKIILCLTISDLASGATMIIEETSTLIFIRDETSKVRLVFRLVFFFITQFCGIMMLAVAFDRYIHMKHLTKYQQVMTQRTLAKFIAFGFATGFFCVAVLMLGYLYDQLFYASLALSANAIILYLSMLGIYSRTYSQLIKRTKALSLHTSGICPRRNANKDFATAALTILVSLVITFAPYFIASVLMEYNKKFEKIAETASLYKVWLSCLVLVKFQTVLDAILLIYFDHQMRRYVRNFFCRIKARRTGSWIEDRNQQIGRADMQSTPMWNCEIE